MTVLLVIAYVLVTCLFLLIGYTTTPRRRLHLGLFTLASILWPLSLLVVVGHICAERTGGAIADKTIQVTARLLTVGPYPRSDGEPPLACAEPFRCKTPASLTDQCRKCRSPVNSIAIPRSSAARMTSSSRTEPPG